MLKDVYFDRKTEATMANSAKRIVFEREMLGIVRLPVGLLDGTVV